MVYRKNFYFTVATVINILHCSILVKQQIQNFKVLKKLISSVLASVSIGRAGLSKFCIVQWTYHLLLLHHVTITFAFSISFY